MSRSRAPSLFSHRSASNRSHWVMAAVAMALPLAWIGVQSNDEPLYVMPGSHAPSALHVVSVATNVADATSTWPSAQARLGTAGAIAVLAPGADASPPYGMLMHAGLVHSFVTTMPGRVFDASRVEMPLLASTQAR